MPDIELPELLRTPLPDEAHEDLRRGVVTAIENLAEQIERINAALLLLVGTSHFAQSVLNTTSSGKSAIAELQVGMVQARGRIAALEALNKPTPGR